MLRGGLFVLGAIAGGVMGWLWGKEIEDYVGDRTRGARAKAADGLRAMDERTRKVFDRGADVLHRADEVLQDTRGHVSEALRAGEETIRPASATGDA